MPVDYPVCGLLSGRLIVGINIAGLNSNIFLSLSFVQANDVVSPFCNAKLITLSFSSLSDIFSSYIP